MIWSFSKTFELVAGPCSPKHGPYFFTVLKNHFVWMLCSHVKTFKFMAWPRSATSPVKAQLISRVRKIISLWCCADMQQRSNEQMVALPQTHSRSFHGVEDFFHLEGMKLFKNFRTYGWAVLSQTRPISFHGVEEHFRLDVMKPIKHLQVDGWAALPNIPCHGPAHFPALKNHFVLLLCRLSTTFKWTDGRAPPNTFLFISRCWIMFWSGSFEAFPKHSNLWLGRAPPNTAYVFSRCWKLFFLHGMKLFKNIRTYGWVVIPQLQPSLVHGVEYPFRLDVLQPFRNIQVYGGAAFPNIPVTAQLISRH